MSESHACPDREAFIVDMRRMFDELDPETIRKYTSDVLRDMIELVRQHQVGVGERGWMSWECPDQLCCCPACVCCAVHVRRAQAVLPRHKVCMACHISSQIITSNLNTASSSCLPAVILPWRGALAPRIA
jgi:hypothetical protein